MSRQVMLIGSFAATNFGDTWVLASTMRELDRVMGADTRYLVPTLHPEPLRQRMDHPRLEAIDIHHRRTASYRFLSPNVFRALPRTDLIATTAGILFDYRLFDPRFNFILSLAPVLARARRRGVPVYGLNVGVTAPRRRLGRYVLRKVLRLHDRIATRDPDSTALLETLAPDVPHFTGADTAHLWPPAPAGPRSTPGDRCIGVNVPAYLGQYHRGRAAGANDRAPQRGHGQARKRAGRSFFAGFADRLAGLAAALEARLVFIATTAMDHQMHERIAAHLPGPTSVCHRRLDTMSVTEGLATIEGVELMIAGRMHACLAATSHAIPTLALAYHPKVPSFMTALGLGQWVLPIDAADSPQLDQMARSLWDGREAVAAHLREALPARRDAARRIMEQLPDGLMPGRHDTVGGWEGVC